MTYEELRLEYEAWLRGSGASEIPISSAKVVGSPWRHQRVPIHAVRADIHVVFPMLIPLGKLKKNPYPLINEPSREVPPDWEGVEMFGCKHLVDGDCTIHDVRPLMCRAYGVSQGCEYKDCTWDGHQEPKHEKLRKLYGEGIEKGSVDLHASVEDLQTIRKALDR